MIEYKETSVWGAIMSGFILLLPFFLIRFGVLSLINKKSVQRAAHFAPVQGKEVIAYWLYQVSTLGIIVYTLFLHIKVDFSILFYTGLTFYDVGLTALFIAIINFSSPNNIGLNTKGIYRISRNPMYVSYFLCFIGIALLAQSVLLFCMVLIFQISAHWIILAEERECSKKFGISYEQYMRKVRRYI